MMCVLKMKRKFQTASVHSKHRVPAYTPAPDVWILCPQPNKNDAV